MATTEATDTRMMTEEIRRLTQDVIDAKARLRDAQRAASPERVKDWTFRAIDGSDVRLSALFTTHDDLIVVHNMGRGCNYCTLWADIARGYADHLDDRCGFVLCSNDPPEVAHAFARERRWNFRVVSGRDSGFARAMGFMDDKGNPWPGASAFHKNEDGSIVRTGTVPWGPGDDFCPVWPFFDILDGGKKGWEPLGLRAD
ncbi:MAG: DUF899 family protein [Planctomycetota bacterium]